MQTFLPFPSFKQSAQVLDMKRLGKQRVEVLQLLNALGPEGAGWANHPAAKMWRGYEMSLAHYGLVVCKVWISQGYNDTCFGKIRNTIGRPVSAIITAEKPPWFGDYHFHLSHRSNLLRKDPVRYGPLFEEGLRADLEYVWPVA